MAAKKKKKIQEKTSHLHRKCSAVFLSIFIIGVLFKRVAFIFLKKIPAFFFLFSFFTLFFLGEWTRRATVAFVWDQWLVYYSSRSSSLCSLSLHLFQMLLRISL